MRQVVRLRWGLRRLRRGYGPQIGAPDPREVARAAGGGAVALLAVSALAWVVALTGDAAAGLALALPLGASAVLIFAVPNSPLAQPWSVLVGNSLSALTGVLVAMVIPGFALAGVIGPALAFGLALPVMLVTRSLHPPGGAMAVSAAVLVQAGEAGPGWAIWPVALQSLILIGVGVVWNRATGRVYPFRVPRDQGRHATRDPAPERRFGLDADHLRALLAEFRQSANIGVEDLGRIIAAAESDVAAQRFGGLTCGGIMSRSTVALTPRDPVGRMVELVGRHGFTSFPVVDALGRVVGIVTQADLIRRVLLPGHEASEVAAIMTRDVRTLPADAPVARLLPMLSDGGVPAVPITENGRLAGIVTRSDMLALLAHELALAG